VHSPRNGEAAQRYADLLRTGRPDVRRRTASPSSPLWQIEQILITPHVSGPIVPEDVVGCFLDNLGNYMRGELLQHQVDRSRGY